VLAVGTVVAAFLFPPSITPAVSGDPSNSPTPAQVAGPGENWSSSDLRELTQPDGSKRVVRVWSKTGQAVVTPENDASTWFLDEQGRWLTKGFLEAGANPQENFLIVTAKDEGTANTLPRNLDLSSNLSEGSVLQYETPVLAVGVVIADASDNVVGEGCVFTTRPLGASDTAQAYESDLQIGLERPQLLPDEACPAGPYSGIAFVSTEVGGVSISTSLIRRGEETLFYAQTEVGVGLSQAAPVLEQLELTGQGDWVDSAAAGVLATPKMAETLLESYIQTGAPSSAEPEPTTSPSDPVASPEPSEGVTSSPEPDAASAGPNPGGAVASPGPGVPTTSPEPGGVSASPTAGDAVASP
jgi:hypothetical protein